MAKTPNASKKTTSNPNTKSQSPPSATSKSKAKAKPSKPTKEDIAKRLAAEQQAFYEANRKRIDDAIAKCLKHFNNNEPDIVRAVARKLFNVYIKMRMQTPKSSTRPIIG